MQKSGIDVIAINNEASVRYLCQSYLCLSIAVDKMKIGQG